MGVVSAAQSVEHRIAELLRLRRKVDDELSRLAVVVGAEKPRRRSRREIPECGTESAYQRHRYYGDPRCEPCLAAHNEHERVRAEIRKARARAERLAQVVGA